MKNQLIDVDSFARQVTATQARLTHLLHEVQETSMVTENGSNFIPSVCKELGVASEEIQVAIEELRCQNEALTATLATAVAERQRYQELFTSLPDAYLVTDEYGCIQEANRRAAELFGIVEKFLVGKPLVLFLKDLHQQSVLAHLLQQEANRPPRTWRLHLEPRDRPATTVTCLVTPHLATDGVITWRWLIREAAGYEGQWLVGQQDSMPTDTDSALPWEGDCLPNQHLARYKVGEPIVIPPQSYCYITQGLVKLTTLALDGEEVLLGILGAGMPFGGDLTNLSNYQAIALSQVELVAIPTNAITQSSTLAQWFIDRVSQRLRQTEELLAISGQRRVSDRLEQFLEFLKREIGQSIAEGMRLSVRLTHEDLANACCTTRVTITRWLGKLHQQGRILFDRKYHIIFLERSKGR
ncbi:PAS domain-containing protein [Pantanalinema rosaneae CENA516]|uniref:Crp/Fnr family transcriptional regulator n=1 Tax=Pantanalinema rosaneae TaxID=1620701 RepID=UPI003D6FBB2D